MINTLSTNWTKLVSESIPTEDRSDLLKVTYNIALVYVRLKYKSHEVLTFQDSTPENLAVDTTAFLFSKTGNNSMRIIEYQNS